ncbi:MAG TPA: hypothetical protein DCO77_11280 [Nitrospiraceae bacterium]|nr:hypothetical protein [Nitrospiraceae bacterium]
MGLFGPKDLTGIDIGTGSIKAVRIATGGGRPKLLAAGMVEFSLDEAKANSVSTDLVYLLSGKELVSKNIATLLPGKYLTIRYLTLPKMPRAELAQAVRWESKRHISYPLEAAEVEYVVLGEKREGTVDKYEILLVAVERGTVIEHLLPFREAGIGVTAVDANPLALRNVFQRRERQGAANVAVVDMGAGKTEINIFKGAALRFSRCLETGGLDMTRAVSQQLTIGLPEAEEVKRAVDVLTPAEGDPAVAAVKARLDSIGMEVRRSVDYYKTAFREAGIERTVLTGGASLMKGITDYFSSLLEGRVELDTPFFGLSGKKSVLEDCGANAPRFASAVGLALRKA